MGWLKNREKLHEAAISSIKAISKNKDLSSKNGIAQRPPSKNQASISSTPRSSKDLSSWRGESDFQAFWHLHHRNNKEVALTLPARMVFNELEMSRVEILGSNEYKGAKKNIIEYLEAKSINMDDEKSPNFLALCSNLWLKDSLGMQLSPASKKLLENFENKYSSIDLDLVKNKFIENIANQNIFEKISLDFLKKLKLLKLDDQSQDEKDDEPFDSPGSTNEIEQENMEDSSDTDTSDSE